MEAEEGNLLLLDEPTNHLDLPARESLERAVREFEGTVIFVSHDRYFISATADCVAEIEGGRLNFYAGGYEFFRAAKREQSRLAELAAEEERREDFARRKTESYRSKKDRAFDAAKKARIKQIEAAISSSEEEEAAIQSSLADPAQTADYKQVDELCRRLEEVKRRQEELYAEYEKLI